MALMRWCETLAVGHAQVDREHVQLVELLNALYRAVQFGLGRDACVQALDALVERAGRHVAAERRLITEAGGPAPADRVPDAAFAERMRALGQQVAEGRVALTVATLKSLMDALAEHLLQPHRALASGGAQEAWLAAAARDATGSARASVRAPA